MRVYQVGKMNKRVHISGKHTNKSLSLGGMSFRLHEYKVYPGGSMNITIHHLGVMK